MTKQPSVVVVCGATATGKSDLAVAIAESLGGEVVGADSRQVYRYLDAGTAKPSAALRSRVRHHVIDVVDPDEDFDVSAWRRLATDAIEKISARGSIPVVCGGTGLYLRSLLRGLFAGPAADSSLRAALVAEEEAQPGILHERLCRFDPAAARRIHANDRIRVVRALEVLALTGRPLSEWHDEHALGDRHVNALVLEAVRGTDELRDRIGQRSREMVGAGLVEEVETLSRRFDLDTKPFSAIGYREARACLRGALPAAELPEAIAASTRAYAKRQRVWLRGQMDAKPVEPDDAETAIALCREFLRAVATRQGIG